MSSSSYRRILLPLCVIALSVVAGRGVETQAGPKPKSQTPKTASAAKTQAPPKTQPLPPEAASPTKGWEERVVKAPVVGQANVYIPRQPATSNVVLFISGDGGWNLGVVDMARRIMPKAIVIGVSYVALRKAVGETEKCWFPSGQLEVIAQAIEHELKLPEYHPPVLLGYSSGATMVYEALAASPYSFAGGLSMGFCPDMPSTRPVCAADNFKPGPVDQKIASVLLPKVDKLSRDWYVVNGVQDQVCIPEEMHKFLDDMGNAHFMEAPGTGHGFGRPVRWGPTFDEAIDKLMVSASEAFKPKRTEGPAPAGSAAALEPTFDALNLPLEYKWADRSKAVLVFVSGDGNWAAIDDHLATYLAARDVSVVGVKARSYFWNERTPQQSGADLGRIVGVAGGLRVPVFVGGYSFGAEVVPFMLDTWSEADRRKVSGEVLVAPGETASFEIHLLDLVMRAKETPRRVADAVRRIRVPTFCLTGQLEEPRDTACDDLGTAGEAMKLPGSHHFNGKYDDVGAAVLAFIDKRMK